ncbi:MAG: DUF3419 family protein [Verrucomicrobiota bacterium]
MPLKSRIASEADFTKIRYAQCWEDADVLLGGLEVKPGGVCVSIASAGDNSLSLLTRDPAKVVALDMNPSQLACLELRVAAYRQLQHGELLELIGARPSERRLKLFEACRDQLSKETREFWENAPATVEAGIGAAGKFERYFATFRNRVLPLIHSRRRVAELLKPKTQDEIWTFYDETWNSWRWRALFRVFFSRRIMGLLGRDPKFFEHVDGPVAPRIMNRAKHALRELDPSSNAYLTWILTGEFSNALPHGLREENFESIRNNLDKLEWRLASIEEFISSPDAPNVDAWNLSDIFEYMPMDDYQQLLELIVSKSNPGARLAYWNMLAPRSRPESMSDQLQSLDELAAKLHAEDNAFFYSAFIVEEVA